MQGIMGKLINKLMFLLEFPQSNIHKYMCIYQHYHTLATVMRDACAALTTSNHGGVPIDQHQYQHPAGNTGHHCQHELPHATQEVGQFARVLHLVV